MNVQTVRAATRREALDETRRRFGPEALILSCRRTAGPNSRDYAWEAIVAREDDAPLPDRPVEPFAGALHEIRRTLIGDPGAKGPAKREALAAITARLAELEAAVLRGLAVASNLKPEWVPIVQKLQSAGLPEGDTVRILTEAGEAECGGAESIDALYARVREHLARRVAVIPAEERSRPGVAVFTGGAGTGKTTLAAMVAADLRLNRGENPVLGVLQPRSERDERSMRHCAEALGLKYVSVHDDPALAALCRGVPRTYVILDTRAANPMDAAAMRGLRRALMPVPSARVHAVVQANHDPADAQQAIAALRWAGANCMSMTRLDEAPYPGRALAAASRSGLPVGYLSTGPRIPDDLVHPAVRAIVDAALCPRAAA